MIINLKEVLSTFDQILDLKAPIIVADAKKLSEIPRSMELLYIIYNSGSDTYIIIIPSISNSFEVNIKEFRMYISALIGGVGVADSLIDYLYNFRSISFDPITKVYDYVSSSYLLRKFTDLLNDLIY